MKPSVSTKLVIIEGSDTCEILYAYSKITNEIMKSHNEMKSRITILKAKIVKFGIFLVYFCKM